MTHREKGMGRHITSFSTIGIPPRTVRDGAGTILGIYFPASHRLRLSNGDVGEVDTTGVVRFASGVILRLDRDRFTLAGPRDEEN